MKKKDLLYKIGVNLIFLMTIFFYLIIINSINRKVNLKIYILEYYLIFFLFNAKKYIILFNYLFKSISPAYLISLNLRIVKLIN